MKKLTNKELEARLKNSPLIFWRKGYFPRFCGFLIVEGKDEESLEITCRAGVNYILHNTDGGDQSTQDEFQVKIVCTEKQFKHAQIGRIICADSSLCMADGYVCLMPHQYHHFKLLPVFLFQKNAINKPFFV